MPLRSYYSKKTQLAILKDLMYNTALPAEALEFGFSSVCSSSAILLVILFRSNTTRMQHFFNNTAGPGVLLRSVLMSLHMDVYSNTGKYLLVYFYIFLMSCHSKAYL